MSEPGSSTTTSPELSSVLTATDRDAVWAEFGNGPPVRRATYFDGTPVWLVTGYDEAMVVLKDPARFSNDINNRKDALDIAAVAGFPPDVEPYLTRTLGAYDPPDHSRLRKLVSRAFTVRRVDALRPRIQQIVDELLTGLDNHDEVEFIETFAYPLPIRVICELLGVPREDLDRWRSWSAGIVTPDPETIAASARGLVAYMTELIEKLRQAPADDLISALVHVHDDDGDRLSDEEMISVSLTILLAGHETTVSLLIHPDQSAALRADLDLVPSAVEEMLRFTGPAEVAPMRYARADVELGGVTIPAGDPVQVVYATANRDPRQFHDPSKLEVTRSQNPHLGFGNGIHYCLGAALARAEADITFRTLLSRFPDLSLATPAEQLAWQPGIGRALTALPVRPRGTA